MAFYDWNGKLAGGSADPRYGFNKSTGGEDYISRSTMAEHWGRYGNDIFGGDAPVVYEGVPETVQNDIRNISSGGTWRQVEAGMQFSGQGTSTAKTSPISMVAIVGLVVAMFFIMR